MIDPNGDYSPDNFRWATRKMQARNKTTNRKVFFNNEEITISELSEKTGIKTGTMLYRINNIPEWANEILKK